MQAKDSVTPAIIAAGAGVAYEREGSNDSFADWMSLMELVEALCPRWPEREPSIGTRYLL